MISRNIRRFATTAYRAAEVASKVDAANQYRVQLAKAQGHVDGFVGGKMLLSTYIEDATLIHGQQSATRPSSE